jgi:hypothetical protein
MRYLSTDSDVDYVVFAHTILHWVDFDDNVQGPNVQKITQRLLRLRPHSQDYVMDRVDAAMESIKRGNESPFVKMAVLGEAQRFISLLSSPNLEAARVASNTIRTLLREWGYLNYLIAQGLIPAVVSYLLTGLRPALRLIGLMLLCQGNKQLATHSEMAATAIPYLVRHIPDYDEFPKLAYIMNLFRDTRNMCECAGFALLLISMISCIPDKPMGMRSIKALFQNFREYCPLRRWHGGCL